MSPLQHFAFVASSTPEAREARGQLEKRYGHVDPNAADVIVALGEPDADAKDWPTYRHDAARSGYTDQALLENLDPADLGKYPM